MFQYLRAWLGTFTPVQWQILAAWTAFAWFSGLLIGVFVAR
jgi:hypothetical protein